MKLKHAADKVIWNQSGTRYATCADKHIIITDIDTGEELFKHEAGQRIHAIAFTTLKNADDSITEVLVTAGEDKLIHIIDVDAKKYLKSICINAQTRIKDFSIAVDGDRTFLITCTSDGVINVANIASILREEFEILESIAEFSTGCRLVCLKVVNLTKMGEVKEKKSKIVEELQSEVESEYEIPKSERVTIEYETEAKEEPKKSKKRKFNASKVPKLKR